MAKITANEYVKVAWVPEAYMTTSQAEAPPESILTGVNVVHLSDAIAWQDFALGATDSDDIDDRGITDPGNAVTRGFANFEGTLSFFRDADPTDVTSPYNRAWNTFKTPRTYGYLVMRVAEKHWSDPFAAGDRVSVFRFVADVITDDTEGDDSVKFTVNFLPQGVLHPYTVVSGALTLAGITPTAAGTIGGVAALLPTLSGKSVRATANYSSDDTAVATVSPNGVVEYISGGTANITVSHAGATADVTQAVTVS